MQASSLLSADDGGGPEVDDEGGDQDGEVCQGVAGGARLVHYGRAIGEEREVSKEKGHGHMVEWRAGAREGNCTKRSIIIHK